MTEHAPPSLATRLMASLLPDADRDAVLGDLAEEYALLAQCGPRSDAVRWYWRQTAASLLPVLIWSLRKAHALRTLGVTVAAFFGAGLIEFAAQSAASAFMGGWTASRWIASLLISFAAMALGGYFATVVRPGTARTLAGIVLAVIAVLVVLQPDRLPMWYQLLSLPLGPIGVMSGAGLGVRSKHRP